MRSKSASVFICFFLLLAFRADLGVAAPRHGYPLRKGPGRKFKVVGRVRARSPVRVIKEVPGWVELKTSRGKRGWITRRWYDRGWRKGSIETSRSVKVDLEFQNIPEACVRIMREKLKGLQKRLPPVGDRNLELVVSALPRLRSYRMFLVIDFNTKFYRHAMKRFSLPTTLDLLPFNGCIWALYTYKKSVTRAALKQKPSCVFTRRFAISLVLKRSNGEEIVLETVEDGVYIYFSPSLILVQPGGKAIRVVSEEPKKVRLLSAFALPYPLEPGDPNTAGAYAVYHFFRDRS